MVSFLKRGFFIWGVCRREVYSRRFHLFPPSPHKPPRFYGRMWKFVVMQLCPPLPSGEKKTISFFKFRQFHCRNIMAKTFHAFRHWVISRYFLIVISFFSQTAPSEEFSRSFWALNEEACRSGPFPKLRAPHSGKRVLGSTRQLTRSRPKPFSPVPGPPSRKGISRGVSQ